MVWPEMLPDRSGPKDPLPNMNPWDFRIKAIQGQSFGLLECGADPDLVVGKIISPSSLEWVPRLLHGTNRGAIDSILQHGLIAGGLDSRNSRLHVHMVPRIAPDPNCEQEGVRGGSTVIVRVDASKAWAAGCKFFLSTNKVYLTPGVELAGQ